MRELLTVLAVLAVTVSGYTSSKCPAAGQTNEVVHIPHEYDCAKFYKCVDGVKQLQMCTEYSGNRKLYFNPEKQVCDWPWNVTCTQRKPECPTEGDEELTLSHPYDCSLYYRCKNRDQLVEKCPEGQHFDFVQMTCMDKEQATCYLFWDVCPPSNFNIDVRFPHKSSCDEYYECRNEKLVSGKCSDGYSFDVNLRKCVLTEEAKCDPALIPEILNGCPPSGIQNIPHETTCGLYYECRNGVKTMKECKGGLSFDPVSGICDWPPSNECSTSSDFECPSVGAGKRGRVPHDCNCTKYYECVDGYKILQNCKNGTEFDYLREVCDVPDKVTCYNRNFEADDVVAEASECPATGSRRIPHELDCNYYYTCTDGQKNLGKCLEGYHFNERLQICDFPVNANCQSKVVATTTPRNGDTNECPVCDCVNCVTRFPDKWDCSKYYECKNGTKTLEECSDGLLYNPDTQMCDWPDNVDCEPPPTVCDVGNKTHHECRCNKYYECVGIGWALKECPEGKLYDYERNECVPDGEANCWPPRPHPNPIPDGCQLIGECPPNSVKTAPHEDCTRYCECNNGTATIVNCTNHMYYNPAKGICDWPENIRNMTCDPFPCPSNSTDKVPHECSCDVYYVCQGGQLIRTECPSATDFNYETGECQNPEVSHCYNEPKDDAVIESEGCVGTCAKLDPADRSMTLPHRNCTKFCRCGAGAPYVVHCRPGLHYDEREGVCMEPSRANCWSDYMVKNEGEDWTRNVRKRSIWDNILPMYFQ